MKIHKGVEDWNQFFGQQKPKTVLTIGNFDGVHLGHQKLILELQGKAALFAAESVVCSFSPHPVQVLFPGKQLLRLFSLEDLGQILAQLSTNHLIIEPFTLALSKLSPLDYFEKYILAPLRPSALVVGHDFSFGHQRKGDLGLLQSYCDQNNVELSIVAAEGLGGGVISSSRIRRHISLGELAVACDLLGRPYYIEGRVLRGKARGTELGFPTINLAPPKCLLPKNGVYLSWVELDNRQHPAITNVGVAPTFGDTGSEPIVESHIFGLNENLYDRELSVHFIQRMRAERKFSSKNELVKQIELDIKKAKSFFQL